MGFFMSKFGGKDRRFELLSADDLRNIMGNMPNPNREIIDLRMLDLWSKNTDGCNWFIWQSLKPSEPQLTLADVGKTGSIMGRVNLASDIFGRSIVSGEEEESTSPKAEGASPPTGS